MRKFGIISLLNYLLYLVGGIVITQALSSFTDEQVYDNIAAGIFSLLAIFLILFGIVATVLKLVHLCSGWTIVGLLCVLIDIFALVIWINIGLFFADSALSVGVEIGKIITLFIPAVASFISLACNAISIRR
ncbi:MAG: hypothetical protein IJW93_03960 [Clostridia bacterium]|nr:hypothetical protein [Clostridia bacterium]